jgi:hypothetical protein
MRRDWVREQLAQAERRAADCRRQIAEQIEFIAWLAWFGNDAMGAKALLRDFERSLARHTSDLQRLRAHLAALETLPSVVN